MKIVVVDDERSIVRLVQVNLERQGYEVSCAFDGREGLAMIEREKPDLVVLDIKMPGLDGLDLLKMIRDHGDPAIQHIPVIMVAHIEQGYEERRALDLGAKAFIRKPFEPHVLVEAVASTLGQSFK